MNSRMDNVANIKVTTLLVAFVACSAFAEEATVKGISWRYSVVDGAARIDNLNQICTGKLDIPAKIGKYRVAEVGDGEHPIASIPGPTSIVIPADVTRIGTFAFGGNKNLREVSLPPKLTSLPEALFHTCEDLVSVKIPASVKSIGVEAFAECRSLKSIVIPEGVKSIGKVAFRDCSGLTSVTIPASVTNIGEVVFIRCSRLAKINVAKGNRAYKSVSGALYTADGTTLAEWPAGSPIADATIPDGVTNIVRYAFSDCPNLVSVAIPASVVRIGDMAFDKCPKLSFLYTDAGNVDRLKEMVAEYGKVARRRNAPNDLDRVGIEERPAIQTNRKAKATH